jgi:hypothetical protein
MLVAFDFERDPDLHPSRNPYIAAKFVVAFDCERDQDLRQNTDLYKFFNILYFSSFLISRNFSKVACEFRRNFIKYKSNLCCEISYQIANKLRITMDEL